MSLSQPHKLRSAMQGYSTSYPAEMALRIGSGFGDTPDGDAWCRRALDPSDETADVRGIPDECTLDVCIEKYQSTILIQAPQMINSTDLVNYEIQLYPNPIAPVDVFCIDTGDSTGGVNSASFTWVNPQILRPLGTTLPVYTQNGASAAPAAGWLNKVNQTTACIQDAYAGFQQSYQETRLLYASLTGIQIAPSLQDQGQILATQQNLNPQQLWNNVVTTTGSPVTAVAVTTINMMNYANNDFPSFGDALNMPRAQQWESRQGVYMPLHLDENFKIFKNIQTGIVNYTSPRFCTTLTSGTVGGAFPASTYAYSPTGAVSASSTMSQIWPCYNPLLSIGSVNASTGIATMTATTQPQTCMPMLSTPIGKIFIYGVNPGTTFQFKFLMGIECPTYAGSPATTHVGRSPELDPKALALFSHITLRYLSDAYPADFNFLGKFGDFLGKIKDYAIKALPTIAQAGMGALQGYAQGGAGGALAGGLGGLMGGLMGGQV